MLFLYNANLEIMWKFRMGGLRVQLMICHGFEVLVSGLQANTVILISIQEEHFLLPCLLRC